LDEDRIAAKKPVAEWDVARAFADLYRSQAVSVSPGSMGLVKPETAQRQLAAAASLMEKQQRDSRAPIRGRVRGSVSGYARHRRPQRDRAATRRFHGSVTLDPARVGRDASRVADEVIAHLSGLVGDEVRVTLEIEAEIPSGASDHVVRTVTENSRTLKFTSQGFENE
jgi:hypothetical protein